MDASPHADAPVRSRSHGQARDEPFKEALDRAHPRSMQWHRYRAGLLVLGHVDRLAGEPDRSATGREAGRFAARRAVAAVEPNAVRILLDRILDALFTGDRPAQDVLEAVRQYAIRLASDGEFKLASRVHRTMIQVGHKIGLVALVPWAYEHLGWCLRELGDAAAATDVCEVGLALAADCGDEEARVRLSIVRATLYRDCHALPNAAEVLTTALKRARALKAAALVGRAAHERGIVAHALHRYVDALVYYSEAFRAFATPGHRHRLLNDIGHTFQALHQTDRARDTWLIVYRATKAEPLACWTAGINLMAMASATGDGAGFDAYRRELERARMRRRPLARYYLELGAGWSAFGKRASARAAYQRAAVVAKRCGFAKELRLATAALRTDGSRRSSQVAPLELPAPVNALIESLGALRAAAQTRTRRAVLPRTATRSSG